MGTPPVLTPAPVPNGGGKPRYPSMGITAPALAGAESDFPQAISAERISAHAENLDIGRDPVLVQQLPIAQRTNMIKQSIDLAKQSVNVLHDGSAVILVPR